MAVDYGKTGTQMARLGIPALHDSGFVGTGVMICMLDDGFNFYDKHASTRDLDVGARTRWAIDRLGAEGGQIGRRTLGARRHHHVGGPAGTSTGRRSPKPRRS